jgi:hypothetical protein
MLIRPRDTVDCHFLRKTKNANKWVPGSSSNPLSRPECFASAMDAILGVRIVRNSGSHSGDTRPGPKQRANSPNQKRKRTPISTLPFSFVRALHLCVRVCVLFLCVKTMAN